MHSHFIASWPTIKIPRLFNQNEKKDKEFVKKPDWVLRLFPKVLSRKYQAVVVLVDGGYGNNSFFFIRSR